MRSNLIKITGFFVAMSGLVSCSPDKSVQDRLDIEAPKFVRTETSLPWDDFLVSAVKELDLDDTIEFPNAPLAQLQVTTKCGFGREIATHSLTLPLRNKLRLSDLFSDRMLAHLSPDTSPVCSLDFVAQNQAGSTRTFEIQSVRISNKVRAKTLELHSSLSLFKDPRPILQTGDRKAVLQMTEWGQHDEFRIQCSDVSFRLGSSATSVHTMDFDFHRPQLETDETIFKTQPAQRCRAFSYLRGQRTAMSDSFTLLFEERMPLISARPEAVQIGIQPLAKDLNFLYRTYQLENPRETALQFVIPKSTAPFLIRLFTAGQHGREGQHGTASISYPAQGFVELGDSKRVVHESVEAWTVELKPLERMDLRILARIDGHRCQRLIAAEGAASQNFYVFLRQKSLGEDIAVPLLPLELQVKMYWGSKLDKSAYLFEQGVSGCN